VHYPIRSLNRNLFNAVMLQSIVTPVPLSRKFPQGRGQGNNWQGHYSISCYIHLKKNNWLKVQRYVDFVCLSPLVQTIQYPSIDLQNSGMWGQKNRFFLKIQMMIKFDTFKMAHWACQTGPYPRINALSMSLYIIMCNMIMYSTVVC
jgi:hypothetical protein